MVVHTTVGVLASLPMIASALCVPEAPSPSPESVPAYAYALADSLSWVRQGVTKGPGRFDENWSVLLSKIKLADEDYRCAASALHRFEASDNEYVAMGASAVGDVYQSLIRADQALARTLTALIKDSKAAWRIEVGSIEDRLATFQWSVKQALERLPVAVATATQGLAIYTATGRPAGGLHLRWAERAELQLRLASAFGPSIREGPRSGQSPVDDAAALLYGFLGDSKSRSATSE
jgi:hypothetical protein